MKNIFVVLGMARSGTSVIASGLNALGIPFGEKLAPAKDLWNPKGFWEDTDIVYKVNRSVMYAIDYTWGEVDWKNEKLIPIKEYAANLLKQRLENTDYYGFKDPRTAKIVPFWQTVFESLTSSPHALSGDLQANYIIVLRNPLSSAYSYQRVTGCDLETGLLLWLIMHLIPAITNTDGKKRIVVSYDAMMQDPMRQLTRIKEFFQIPDLADKNSLENYAKEFLDKSLQHYEYTREDLDTHPLVAITPLCKNVFDLLDKLAKDEITFTSEVFKSEWNAILESYELIAPIYNYMDTINKQNRQLESTLRSIRRSIPWKLTYPLRVIDDKLRAFRRQSREKTKLMKSYAK